MADISQITAPNNTTYNIKDATARDTLDKQAHVFYVAGPTTDSAGVWTGSIEGLTAYYDGLTIIYTTGVAGKSGSTSLNINNIGAIPCYLTDKGSITALTTHYPAGTPIPFTYVNGKFIHADYSRANDNTTVIHTLYHQNGNFVANSVIYRYQLLFHVDADKLTPLNNVSNGYNSTTKTILTNVEFDPFGEIFYYNTTTTISANADIGNGSLYYSYGSVDLRYSLNISATVNALTAQKDVYIKVSPQSSGKVKLAAAFPLVQALPSSADGYWYIYLGRAYSTYQISLYPYHAVYYHNGTEVVQKYPTNDTQNVWYGVCSTAGSTQAKTVSIPGITSYKEGLRIRVAFTNGQEYAGLPTLNVNSIGAANIYTCTNQSANKNEWRAGEVLDLVYYDYYWVIVGSGYGLTTSGLNQSVATIPDDYKSHLFFQGIKNRSLWTTRTDISNYAHTIGFRGYPDNSAGYAYEIGAFNECVMVRRGDSNAWDETYLLPLANAAGVGSTTQPVYVNNMGQVTACNPQVVYSASTAPSNPYTGMVWLKQPPMTIEEAKCLIVTSGAISSLPTTIEDSSITSDMIVIGKTLSVPLAQAGAWTWTTADGSVTLSGDIAGTTYVTLYLLKSR